MIDNAAQHTIAWFRARHAGTQRIQRRLHCPRRQNPGSAAKPQELTYHKSNIFTPERKRNQ